MCLRKVMASQQGCVQLAFIIFSFIKINAERNIRKISFRTSQFIYYLKREIRGIKITKYLSNAIPQVDIN